MISYRYAQRSDVPVLCDLLLEVSFISQFLYGSTYTQKMLLEKVKEALYAENGKSSYRNIYVACDQEKVIGLVNYYDAEEHKIDEKMRTQFSANLLKILDPLYQSKTEDALYISALIVDANYRNNHIGVQLMQRVIEEAKIANRNYISLHAWEENQRGIQFYKNNQFLAQEHFILQTDSMLLPPSKKLWFMVKQIAAQ